ncbi:MAG: 2-dehydro-3-deoxyphosphogluconate aldolase/(4S)-4-hydroxy-2-oxoglutarate aldolase [Cryomorphaceae bacterium]|jgi:2-dehydro-3-deoxyphosphogluconate aldolase/(4S)-4-hydroxy-2-oxoglutarate aldolase
MNKNMRVGELLGGQKIVPVVVIENEQEALGLAEALLQGGINVIEITLRNEFAVNAIKLIKNNYPAMLVLAGTVNTVEQLKQVVDAGVDGFISPGITKTLADAARELNVPYLPGVATASDILTAIECGLSECKLFPATVVGGVNALKAFAGPFANIIFCPTGGVSESNYQDFLALDNVMCVGGSWIAPSSLIQNEQWAEITCLCKAVTQ